MIKATLYGRGKVKLKESSCGSTAGSPSMMEKGVSVMQLREQPKTRGVEPSRRIKRREEKRIGERATGAGLAVWW